MDETHEPIDAALRAAGHRIRATAPGQGATEAALDALDERRPSRIRWVLPTALVGSAAAVVVAIALAGGHTDDAVVGVPAETPPGSVSTTAAVPASTVAGVPAPTATSQASGPTAPPATVAAVPPTPAPTTAATTSTTTTTSTTQPGGAAFVGDLPVTAPAGVLGCPGTLGELADAVTPAGWPIARVACAGDYAVVSATVDELLQRTSGGWTVLDQGDPLGCPAVAPEACAAFETDDLSSQPLPLPPAAVVEDLAYLAAQDVTADLQALGATGADPHAFAEAVAAGLAATPGDPIPRTEAGVLEGRPVITVEVRGIPDDSSSRAFYVVEWTSAGRQLATFRAASFAYCDRGGGHETGLCV